VGADWAAAAADWAAGAAAAAVAEVAEADGAEAEWAAADGAAADWAAADWAEEGSAAAALSGGILIQKPVRIHWAAGELVSERALELWEWSCSERALEFQKDICIRIADTSRPKNRRPVSFPLSQVRNIL
jgi:hypothetical protein